MCCISATRKFKLHEKDWERNRKRERRGERERERGAGREERREREEEGKLNAFDKLSGYFSSFRLVFRLRDSRFPADISVRCIRGI